MSNYEIERAELRGKIRFWQYVSFVEFMLLIILFAGVKLFAMGVWDGWPFLSR
jgi:hypothetical protein